MDPVYARYGKDISAQFDQLDDIDNQNWPLFHVHDFGPNVTDAEASLESWTHFEGITSYDGDDLGTLFTTFFTIFVQHRTVLQNDKQSVIIILSFLNCD